MLKEVIILDDIIDIDAQILLSKYVLQSDLNWIHNKNITGEYGGTINTHTFPADVLSEERIDSNILEIIKDVQSKVCDILNKKLLKTYRVKINKTSKLDFEYNPNLLMHLDMPMEHIVIVYYINDIDGDTKVFNNKLGNDMASGMKNFNGIDVSNFELLNSVSPKQGRVVVFNGNYIHYGEYPTKGDRYIINIDCSVSKDSKSLI
jgi:hypothetical protein